MLGAQGLKLHSIGKVNDTRAEYLLSFKGTVWSDLVWLFSANFTQDTLLLYEHTHIQLPLLQVSDMHICKKETIPGFWHMQNNVNNLR